MLLTSIKNSVLAIATTLIAFSGCSSSGPVEVKLNQFQNCSELAEYYKDSLSFERSNSSRTQEMDARNASAGSAGTALEEGDQVKIAGDRLITAQYQKVQIVNIANPSSMFVEKTLDYTEPRSISSTVSENLSPREIVVVNNKLYVILGSFFTVNGGTEMDYASLPSSSVMIDVYDLNSPTLQKVKTHRIDGEFNQLRVSESENKIHLLTTTWAQVISETKVISDSVAESSVGKINRGESAELKSCDCEDLYYLPVEASSGGRSIAHIHSLSTTSDSETLKQEFSIVGSNPILRATNYGYLLSLALNRESKIELALSDSISNLEAPANEDKSLIILAREAGGGLQPQSQGLVRGRVMEQFNMEVRGDIVQVFSMILPDDGSDMVRGAALSTASQQQTLLTTLKANAMALEQIHSIDRIGEDEALFSTLFTDGKAYAVTSKVQIFWDPLFAFDLSDFSQPKLVGQLEIDGFSRQLQETPFGSILAIGREAPNQQMGGIHVSLFGENATLIDREVFGTSTTYSAAAGSGFFSVGDDGYKSYLYDSSAGLVFLPSSHNDWDFSGRAWTDLLNENKVNLFRIEESQVVALPAISVDHYVSRVLKAPNAYYFVNEGQVLARSLGDPATGLGLIALP